MTATPQRQLLELRLGRPLTDAVSQMRADGLSWRRMAKSLTADTGVAVSHETLRAWFSSEGVAA